VRIVGSEVPVGAISVVFGWQGNVAGGVMGAGRGSCDRVWADGASLVGESEAVCSMDGALR